MKLFALLLCLTLGYCFTVYPSDIFAFGSITLSSSSVSFGGGYNQTGSFWYRDPIDLCSYVTDISFQLVTQWNQKPGDGFVFVMQSNSVSQRASPLKPTLGVGNMKNMTGIEFDYVSNQECNDPQYPHLAVITEYDQPCTCKSYVNNKTFPLTFYSGFVQIHISPTSKMIKLFSSGSYIFSVSIEDFSLKVGCNMFIGFVYATYSNSTSHYSISNWEIRRTPPSENRCEGSSCYAVGGVSSLLGFICCVGIVVLVVLAVYLCGKGTPTISLNLSRSFGHSTNSSSQQEQQQWDYPMVSSTVQPRIEVQSDNSVMARSDHYGGWNLSGGRPE